MRFDPKIDAAPFLISAQNDNQHFGCIPNNTINSIKIKQIDLRKPGANKIYSFFVKNWENYVIFLNF